MNTAAWLICFPVLPLLAAALLVIVRSGTLGRVAMIGLPLMTTLAAVALVAHHARVPVIAHHFGRFPAAVSIVFVSDSFSALMIAVTGLATTACAVYLTLTGEDCYRFVPPLLLMLHAGVNGALLTGDLFNLFVFIEVMLLPSFALIAVTGTWRRLSVGRTFIIVNVVTSTTLLMGIGFVYGVAGTVNVAALENTASTNPQLAIAFSVVLAALGVKAAVVPVHGWLPSTYSGTSAGVMALFSGVHTKVALYAMYRIWVVVFDRPTFPMSTVLLVLVVAGTIFGAVATGGHRRMRAALGYQMISGVASVLMGLVIMSAASVAAGILYLVHHVVTMTAVLLAAAAIEQTYGTQRIDRLGGLMRRDPLVATVMAFGFVSLVGLPPTSGVWAKVALVRAAVQAGGGTAVVLGVAITVASVVSLISLQRVWSSVFWGPPVEHYRPDDARTGRGRPVPLPDEVRVPTKLVLPAAAMMAVSVALFVGAQPFVAATNGAGAVLTSSATYVQAVLG